LRFYIVPPSFFFYLQQFYYHFPQSFISFCTAAFPEGIPMESSVILIITIILALAFNYYWLKPCLILIHIRQAMHGAKSDSIVQNRSLYVVKIENGSFPLHKLRSPIFWLPSFFHFYISFNYKCLICFAPCNCIALFNSRTWGNSIFVAPNPSASHWAITCRPVGAENFHLYTFYFGLPTYTFFIPYSTFFLSLSSFSVLATNDFLLSTRSRIEFGMTFQTYVTFYHLVLHSLFDIRHSFYLFLHSLY